jgi:hypothetical protein
MKRIMFAGAAAAAALAGSIALAAPAMASSGPQQAVTHLNNHPDTTGICNATPVPGSVIGPDCVWAYDNATEKFTVTLEPNLGPDTYLVTMDYVGSFHGFADPRVPGDTNPGTGQGAALDSNGSVKGTIAYDVVVQPGTQPDLSALPGQVPSDTHISDNIATLFDGKVVPNGITQHGQYIFTYHKVAGADYTQVG